MPLRELLAWFRIRVDDSQLDRADAGLRRVVNGLKGAAATLGGAFALHELGQFLRRTIEAADTIGETAEKLGITTDALQEFRFAAARSGVETTTLDMALQRFVRRVGEAAQGGGELHETLRQYGIAVRDSAGRTRSTEAIFGDLADTIAGAETQQERLRIAFKAFDSEGAALVTLMQSGSAGVEELRQRFRALGGGFGRDVIAQASAADDAMLDFSVVLTGLKGIILSGVLPPLTRMASGAIELIADFNALASRTYLVEAALGVLAATAAIVGVVLFIAFAKIIIPVILIAALIAGLVLIVDDLIALFSGGESVIGDFIDSLFGAGTAAQLVEDISAEVEQLVEFFEDVIATSEEWKEGLQAVGIALALIAGGAVLTILLVLTAIALIAAAIVAAVVLWVLMVGATVKAAKKLWETLQEIGAFLADLFGPAIDAAGEFFTALVDFVVAVGELIWTILSGAFETVFTWVSDRISELLDGIMEGVSRVAGFLGIDLESAGGLGDTLNDTARRAAEFGEEGIRAGSDLAARGLTASAGALRSGTQAVQQTNQTVINLQTNDPAAAAAAVSRGQRSSNANAARELEGALVQGA